MAKHTAQSICNEAARLIQLKIGGTFQTTQLFPFLNEEYEYIWNYNDWQGLLRTDVANLTVGQTLFTLSMQYKKLVATYFGNPQMTPGLYLFDSIETAENALYSILRNRSAEWLPEPACALYTSFFGEAPLLQQPTTPTDATPHPTPVTVKVVSDSASDTAVKVLLVGDNGNGYEVTETITLTGTTPVTSSKSYARISSASSDGTQVGNISIKSADAATTLGVIGAGDRTSYYAQYQMSVKATVATPVYFVGKLRFRPFRDNIQPPFMDGIAAALKFGTCARAMVQFRQNEYANDFYALRDAELTRALSERVEPQDQRIVRC